MWLVLGVLFGRLDVLVNVGLFFCFEKICLLNGFLGVVKVGLWKGDVVFFVEMWGVKVDDMGRVGSGFVGDVGCLGDCWRKGFGWDEVLVGLLKIVGCEC